MEHGCPEGSFAIEEVKKSMQSLGCSECNHKDYVNYGEPVSLRTQLHPSWLCTLKRMISPRHRFFLGLS